MKKRNYFFICLLFTISSSFTISQYFRHKDQNPLIGEWEWKENNNFDAYGIGLKIKDSINIEIIGGGVIAVGTYIVNKNDSVIIDINYAIESINNETIYNSNNGNNLQEKSYLYFNRKNNILIMRDGENIEKTFYPKNHQN